MDTLFTKQNGFIQKVKVKVDKSIKYCLLNKKLKKLKDLE